jgi:hypothetical protein
MQVLVPRVRNGLFLREDAAGDTDARHDDRRPADGGLIDHDGDPAASVVAQREADEPRRHLGTVPPREALRSRR